METSALTAGYGRTTVLREVNLTVAPGSVVALLGPNGAGKTTLLKTIGGLLAPMSGSIRLDGVDITGQGATKRAAAGICVIPEGRGVFPGLTVRENLLLAVDGPLSDHYDLALEVFPEIGRRLNAKAGSLSGGQQQMVALARAFVPRSSIVVLDEVSMGLAPLVVDQIFAALAVLRKAGKSVLLVEQYVGRALAGADVVHLLDRGRLSEALEPSALDEDELTSRYLGIDVATA
ncbi:ABC transporter ATP-binding protein [Rhodococcus sp. PSBB066]|nr:ABC transporter ATP-binding protein [Rhodococcus aetherivorans]QSE62032.1 ABC transporter ATP-binding protein [Rhodococcus sp. PSBB066]QSE72074.1 ABC transporter ATP-binding protein [Rhodococcus sp. PSBB049]